MSIDVIFHSAEVVVGISFLIFIHELGHFLMAKKIGVRVEAFSLGFGPHVGWKWGETDYRLSLIPLGGYVKLAGENAWDESTGDPREFMAKSVGQRASVFIAGVVMNALFAFLMFILAFRLGVAFSPAEVGDVAVGWPAWEAGLEPGDVIAAIDGRTMHDFEDISTTIALSDDRKGLQLDIKRDGKTQSLVVYPRHDPEHGFQRIGIFPREATIVESVRKESPAWGAGIRPGDRIVSVDGKPIDEWEDLRNIVLVSAKKPLNIVVERASDGAVRAIETTATPAPSTQPMIGVSCGTNEVQSVRRGSAADRFGIRPGDTIIAINGRPVQYRSDIVLAAQESDARVEAVKIRRGAETSTLTPKGDAAVSFDELLGSAVVRQSLVIDTVEDGFPAKQVGLMRGDRILAIGDAKLGQWDDLVKAVHGNGTRPTEIRWRRGNEDFVAEIAPALRVSKTSGRLGIAPMRRLIVRRYSLLGSCAVGCHKAVTSLKHFYLTIRGFATKQVSTKNVGGIILIAQASYHSAKLGLGKLFYFLGIISMHLAILNVLPIPVLDGGHLLFCAAEKLKGKPVGERWIAVANYVGITFVLLLVFYVTKNDIVRLLDR